MSPPTDDINTDDISTDDISTAGITTGDIGTEGSTPAVEPPMADAAQIRLAMEYYASRDWTDGLPVIPVTESYLAEFLAVTGRKPDDVVFSMPQLNRQCTVRLAAINAAMAGCLPEYFPVVLAAWDSLVEEGYPAKGIWQSTTGTAPLLLVNGPVRGQIGLNSQGNVFGSGFRANATIGRAIRLTAINVFGLRPHLLDQATQGTPAKYSACIAENEEESPWPGLHTDFGFAPSDSTVTAMVIRSCMHIEARHTTAPEQLALDIAGTIARPGGLVHPTTSALVVLGPEHAHVFSRAGWGKPDIQRFLYDHAVCTHAQLAAVGKESLSRQSRWRLPASHPDAVPDPAAEGGDGTIRMLNSPGAALIAVAGAHNAGISAVIETFGPRGGPPPVTHVTDIRSRA
jgi:hypothetical protein